MGETCLNHGSHKEPSLKLITAPIGEKAVWWCMTMQPVLTATIKRRESVSPANTGQDKSLNSLSVIFSFIYGGSTNGTKRKEIAVACWKERTGVYLKHCFSFLHLG